MYYITLCTYYVNCRNVRFFGADDRLSIMPFEQNVNAALDERFLVTGFNLQRQVYEPLLNCDF